jgi:hypothetical protein
MHPNATDINSLTDSQIEQKILKLNSIYFMTENDNVRQQIILLLDTYKLELENRRVISKKKDENDNSGLDGLIKIN